jgi:hypothetical protein
MTKDIGRINEFASIINDAIEIMKNFNPTKDIFKNMTDEIEIISIQGADSIFFIFPCIFRNVFIALKRISLMQLMLAMRGIYVRGSINLGTMLIDKENSVYFGEAWNKAVVSEAQANYPRIIIENNLAKFFEYCLKQKNEGVLEYYLDDDGIFVLSSYDTTNFIELMNFTDFNEYKDLYAHFLEILEVNVEKYKSQVSVLQKYLWILRQFARQRKDLDDEIERVKNRIISLITD